MAQIWIGANILTTLRTLLMTSDPFSGSIGASGPVFDRVAYQAGICLVPSFESTVCMFNPLGSSDTILSNFPFNVLHFSD